eukprot:5622229-Pyramimonas_sp.AAC.1
MCIRDSDPSVRPPLFAGGDQQGPEEPAGQVPEGSGADGRGAARGGADGAAGAQRLRPPGGL